MSLNIGIDIRTLLTPHRTGVGEYTYELLNALFKIDKENQYLLFANAAGESVKYLPKWEQSNVHYIITRWPNKVLSSSLCLFKRPRLDDWMIRELGKKKKEIRKNGNGNGKWVMGNGGQCNNITIDVWFSPNLNFTSVSHSTKSILTIHDLSFEHFPDCYSWKRLAWHRAVNARKQCERADIILTPSENTRRDVCETYKINPDKIRVLQPGLSPGFTKHGTSFDLAQDKWNMEQVKRKYGLPAKFILFLGTVEPRKNIIGLIEAYKVSCSMLHAPCSMIIAGPLGWKYKPIIQIIEKTPGVRYIGYVAPEDKPALYRLADLFVYPSLYEGFGFPVLEAMASGTPVITSSRSSLPEITDGAAYLVNPLNVAEMAEGMKLVLENAGVRAVLVEKGRARAEMFAWEKTAREFLDALSR